jgi:ATP-dependent helicase HrpB
MQPLPIDPHLPAIAAALGAAGALVLVAPPGAGKTTRVPPALLAAEACGRLVLLQPRRIAARAAACRIAEERGWRLGGEVGYRVRFESRVGPATRIHVVTEGILIRQLQSNPFLEGVGTVILDEFHERSLAADLALALLAEVRATARPDLRLLVMSATLEAEPVAAFLGGCPILSVEGRRYPVEVRHLARPSRLELAEDIARAVREAWGAARGHLLVFLPGIAEIRQAARTLESFAAAAPALILPLHGSLSLAEQQAALAPAERRKIILSTNIAETSLTIEGVDTVIDSGLARIQRQDLRHGIDRLEVVRISKHSAEQRAGRAGRLGPGRAIRLWSEVEHATLPLSEAPEIRRVDLAGTVLELRAWGVADPGGFRWFEAPPPGALERAEDLLLALGALEEKGGPLTATGRAMLALPAHPRLSRLLLAAGEAGLAREGSILAALLEEKDILRRSFACDAVSRSAPAASAASDLLLRLELLEEAERLRFRRDSLEPLGLDVSAARAVARLAAELHRAARSLGGAGAADRRGRRSRDEVLLAAILAAYPDRVARRREKGSHRGLLAGGRGVALAPESAVRDGELFVAVDLDDRPHGPRREALVRMASHIERRWLEELFPGELHEVSETAWDPAAEKVRSRLALCYRGLPLEEAREHRPPREEAERILAEVVRRRAEEILLADERAVSWLRRVRCLAAWRPELGLPPCDAAALGEALAATVEGKTSLAEVRSQDLLGIAQGMLTYAQRRAIEEEAPEALRAPSGSLVRLEYAPGKPPVLAVRLQELFGLAETPRIAAGRVPVLLHLLGPNFRPVQVTQDLRSFWNTTYAQVRKDLRGRYPKHSWPEDPWKAAPERGPKRRGQA